VRGRSAEIAMLISGKSALMGMNTSIYNVPIQSI
jgi:hypothetical protein